MKLNHVILHVFDFVSCVNTFAQEEIDTTDKTVKSYVTRHIRRALECVDNNSGKFSPDSSFSKELRDYLSGNGDFRELSIKIGDYIVRELGRMEKSDSCDLLVVDFEEDLDSTVRDMTEEEAEAAYKGKGARHLAFFLLESKQAFVHETSASSNTIARHRAVLPSPSQKVQSYALIDADSLHVVFHDKKRIIAGEEKWLIADGLLNCSTEASCKESIETLQRIVEYVAESNGANSTVAVSKSKAFLSDNADVSANVDVEALGRDVFAGDDTMFHRYEEALVEESLPRQVTMKQSTTKKVTKTHRIRTDTGIDIAFPAEYGKRPELIEFITSSDGHMSIEIKNVGHIENR